MKMVSLALLLLSAATVADATPAFLLDPSGQATGNSCQSYALAVALAFKRDPAFSVQTAAELRNTEISIREKIKQAAGTNPVDHSHVKAGFHAYTNGKYKLTIRPIELTKVGEEVTKRSGVGSEQTTPPSFLLGNVVKDVVLASATRIGNDSYNSGHIFAMLGASGPANSQQKFLVLNSGVKIKNTSQKACVNGVPDDPGSYTATLSWKASSDIDFKLQAGQVLLWIVDK